MPWESLAKSIDKKPLVLAGPMLRKATPTSVTVWLAMRVGATVTLTVQDDKGVQVMQGKRRSAAIGKNLHIVAVTATPLPPLKEITEGIVYRYDLAFNFDDNFSCNLATAAPNVVLAYPPWTLPSFALPPKDLNLLRLVQGSCRKPHAEGTDMLPFIDKLIEQSADNAYARPHQLLLTGDQIYADDVSEAMSLLLSDAGDVLLGWTEQYPSSMPANTQRPVTDLHPDLRKKLLKKAGFTSEDLRCHLFGLGEYLAMYLFVWSDVLWPAGTATVPTFDELAAKFSLSKSRRKAIDTANKSLQNFRGTLPQVRRLLANVPSYMIFDDHEVTDDWNMTREFCQNVYGSDLGLRIVQNGLVAYSLCQHWGNVPEDFETSDSVVSRHPGATLLALIDTPQPTIPNGFDQKAADYANRSPDIRKLLGVHSAAAVKKRDDSAVFHEADALQYNFSVEGPGHQVIFTDTRTWRSFPEKANGTHLLTRNQQTDQYKQQILDTPDTGDRLLFVVLTTNAPPVQPIRAATRHNWLSNHSTHFPDIYEAWDLPSVSFDRLLVALTSKLPINTSNQHAGAVVLLSGDVHFSFASRIMYRATKRYEDDVQPRGATAVIAQLVTSSFKKQDKDTTRFQREGYYAAPHPWVTQRMIRHTLTEGYVGWNFPKGAREKVCEVSLGAMRMPLFVDRETVDVSPTKEQLSGKFSSRTVDLLQAAHYRYRFDYLRPTTGINSVPAPAISPLPVGSSPEQRKTAARTFNSALKHYRVYNTKNPPKVVGVNNFGEIRLDWGGPESRKVNYIVHWQGDKDGPFKSTTYAVRLDINSPTDPEFPDIKARVEP
ncbi:hypothetical protein [Nodosilinea nodulosa]|uniref:hypothetical protein n=1 Tax=Nodosilinea nodulosa TaxID=416001 RepID=UPI0002DE0A86|nr:hypothetical protein [Nodosilinea nodulosa]